MIPLAGTSANLGRAILGFVEEIGGISLLTGRILAQTPRLVRSGRLLVDQMLEIGNRSMPLVFVVSIFTGAVTAVQASYQFQAYVPLILLRPVLTALVVGGRVSASIAAELGTMRVTEQVDALEAMAIDPVRYLALPRFWAAVVMMPALTVLADLLAILGAWVVALLTVPGMTNHLFVEGLKLHFYLHDFYSGLAHAVVYGMIIAVTGCFYGLRAGGGAEGVGRATMKAVVANCLAILVLDYFLATVLFQILFGKG
jgi:phospholipid/cholesterol/gamma-HCH transport system permease protein